MTNAPDYELNIWDNEDAGTLQFYPFVFGPDGKGEIHAGSEAQPEGESVLSPAQDVSNTRLDSSSTLAEPSASSLQAPQSTQPGVVSYAIPTINTPLPPLPASTLALISSTNDASSDLISTASNTIQTSANPVITRVISRIVIDSSITPFTPTVSGPSPDTSSTISVTTSVVLVTPNTVATPSPTPSTPIQVFRHTPGFIALIIIGVLLLLGTTLAGISWLFRRTKRKDDENWIGSLVYDEPADYGAKNPSRKATLEPEKGNSREDPGRARVGAGVGVSRGWTLNNETHETYTRTPISGYPFAVASAPRIPTPDPVHSVVPNPDYGHPAILQRGAPPAIPETDRGLTFCRGRPLTQQYADIATPNPYSPHPRLPDATHDSASHYSYALDAAGPFAVTNLLPGDISSATSSTSLAKTSGLPVGRLNDPNPWKRYEGVENRGGAAAGSEPPAGWVDSIRSGLHTTVERIVGGARPVDDLEDGDKFTQVPEPNPRRARETSTSSTRSRQVGRQARILERLGSADSRSTRSSSSTTYSSDQSRVYSTRATSRRDTVSTRATTRTRSLRGPKKDDEDDGSGGTCKIEARAMSATSSEWGSGGLAQVLGMEIRRSQRGRAR